MTFDHFIRKVSFFGIIFALAFLSHIAFVDTDNDNDDDDDDDDVVDDARDEIIIIMHNSFYDTHHANIQHECDINLKERKKKNRKREW